MPVRKQQLCAKSSTLSPSSLILPYLIVPSWWRGPEEADHRGAVQRLGEGQGQGGGGAASLVRRTQGHTHAVCWVFKCCLPAMFSCASGQIATVSSWWMQKWNTLGWTLMNRRGSAPSFQVWPLFLFINSQKGHIPDFPNLPLFPSISALSLLFRPNPCYLFLLPLLFAPDQLIMSGKEGHYPEVISWVLSGWCISPAWWRSTLLPERLSFSFPLRLQMEGNKHRMLLKCTAAKPNVFGKQIRMSHLVEVGLQLSSASIQSHIPAMNPLLNYQQDSVSIGNYN